MKHDPKNWHCECAGCLEEEEMRDSALDEWDDRDVEYMDEQLRAEVEHD